MDVEGLAAEGESYASRGRGFQTNLKSLPHDQYEDYYDRIQKEKGDVGTA